MLVIGTAGHVDHGKSSLVLALTGIDPDRLPEEKEREMTIDLGFAWMELPNGEEVGIVDVPGHERFVKNMIAGAGGMDCVLFLVAADDGWMPQTQEHLEILNLLRIKLGIIVITKTDLAGDDWLALLEEDIREKVKGTILAQSPVVKVSSKGRTGLENLKEEIYRMTQKAIKRKDLGKPRLYIDRVFTIAGRGTVVTGTLLDGSFSVDEEVEILPSGLKGRIRGLQTHKKEIRRAVPGSRVAINLAGMEKQEVSRGQVVVKPTEEQTTKTINAKVQVISKQSFPLRHGQDLVLILGTTEVMAKAILFEDSAIKPGDSGYVRFKLRGKTLARIGDNFILRIPSPALTIAGGKVLDISTGRIGSKKREFIEYLKQREDLDPYQLVLTELGREGSVPINGFLFSSLYSQREIQLSLEELEKKGKLVLFEDLAFDLELWNHIQKQIIQTIQKEHKDFPFKPGLALSQLDFRMKTKSQLKEKALKYLVSKGEVTKKGDFLSLPQHRPKLDPKQEKLSQGLLIRLAQDPFSSPTKDEFLAENPLLKDVISFLVENGELIGLKDGILFRSGDFESAKDKITSFIKTNGPATVSRIRQHLNTSRKYLIPLLERLDEMGITRREGDKRELAG